MSRLGDALIHWLIPAGIVITTVCVILCKYIDQQHPENPTSVYVSVYVF
jgi:hypothetical protein